MSHSTYYNIIIQHDFSAPPAVTAIHHPWTRPLMYRALFLQCIWLHLPSPLLLSLDLTERCEPAQTHCLTVLHTDVPESSLTLFPQKTTLKIKTTNRGHVLQAERWEKPRGSFTLFYHVDSCRLSRVPFIFMRMPIKTILNHLRIIICFRSVWSFWAARQWKHSDP